MTQDNSQNIDTRRHLDDDEIDLVMLAKTVWNNRKIVIRTTIIFIVLGIIVAFGSRVEYEASCKLLPESEDGINMNLLGGLGSLASMAGFDLSSMGNSYNIITPELYPELLKSLPFQLKVLNNPVYFEKLDSTYTPFYYFKEVEKPTFLGAIFKYTIGLPFLIKDWFTDSENEIKREIKIDEDMVRISIEEEKIIQKFEDRISLDINTKTGIVTLTAEMPDANASAEVANYAFKILTEYIIEYKTSKVQNNLVFIQERFNEAKADFEKIQNKLAVFNDRNKNVVNSVAQAEQDRIQNEYNIAFDVYKELATQLEQAKIMVKKETPVFKVLEPVQIPLENSKPNRILLILMFSFMGIFMSMFVIWIRNTFKNS